MSPGVVPDVLVYTRKMSTFLFLSDLEVLCPKIYKAKQRFTSAGRSGQGDFWELRRCCSSQDILLWPREEREHNQKRRCTPQAVKFLLLLFDLGIFLQDQKIPTRMTPEGKAIFPCSLTGSFLPFQQRSILFNLD